MPSPAGPGQPSLTLTPWFCSLLCTTPPPPELEHQRRRCRNASGTHKGPMQPPRPHPQVRSGAQAIVPSDAASEKTCPVWSPCPAPGRFPRRYQAASGRGFYSVCRHFRDDGLSLLHEPQGAVMGLHPVSARLGCCGPGWSRTGQQSGVASSCSLSLPPLPLSPFPRIQQTHKNLHSVYPAACCMCPPGFPSGISNFMGPT